MGFHSNIGKGFKTSGEAMRGIMQEKKKRIVFIQDLRAGMGMGQKKSRNNFFTYAVRWFKTQKAMNLNEIIRIQVLMYRVALKESLEAKTEYTRIYQRGYARGIAIALRDMTSGQKCSPALLEQYKLSSLRPTP
jgi:hypothetical protein